MPKPLTATELFSIGDVLDLQIENTNPNNEGISHVEDVVVFVKGGRKGERCKARIIDLKRTYAIAERI